MNLSILLLDITKRVGKKLLLHAQINRPSKRFFLQVPRSLLYGLRLHLFHTIEIYKFFKLKKLIMF